jgi:tellurite resistance protein TerC
VLIFQYFAVPAQYQHRVLFWGILGALIMRGLFIGLGTALLARFEWIIYVFGALLVITGVRMALKQDEEFEGDQNPVVKLVRRIFPITDGYRGKDFFVLENGKRYATPLMLVLVLVEATDLIFAIDSIPAIFGITRDPVHRLHVEHLRRDGTALAVLPARARGDEVPPAQVRLAVILTFVGVKMIIEPWVHIPILLSLGVVLGVLLLSIVASLIWPRAHQASEGTTGSMFGRLPPTN